MSPCNSRWSVLHFAALLILSAAACVHTPQTPEEIEAERLRDKYEITFLPPASSMSDIVLLHAGIKGKKGYTGVTFQRGETEPKTVLIWRDEYAPDEMVDIVFALSSAGGQKYSGVTYPRAADDIIKKDRKRVNVGDYVVPTKISLGKGFVGSDKDNSKIIVRVKTLVGDYEKKERVVLVGAQLTLDVAQPRPIIYFNFKDYIDEDRLLILELARSSDLIKPRFVTKRLTGIPDELVIQPGDVP